MGEAEVAEDRWTFFGRVLPERAPLYAEFPPVEVDVSDLGFRFIVTPRIAASQVMADVAVSGTVDVFTLRNSVEDIVRWYVDLIGYQQGLALDVEIISASGAGGTWRIFGADNPALWNQRRGNPAGLLKGELPGELMVAVVGEPATMTVLADFREALKSPHQTGFFCYRAVEAVMQTFKKPSERGDAAAWAKMRRALNVERAALELVKSHADWARHGSRRSITDTERRRLLILADEVIRRFLEHLKRGEAVPDPHRDPPLLPDFEPVPAEWVDT